MTTSAMQLLLDRCWSLGASMVDVEGLPEGVARQIAEAADAVATADRPDWAVYFSTTLSSLSAGSVGHLTLEAPARFDELLGDIREARQTLRPLVAPTLTDPGLRDELREWQRRHGLTPVVRDEPSPLR